ncbi:unnamed protein product, partial [Owenia fusiformis]
QSYIMGNIIGVIKGRTYTATHVANHYSKTVFARVDSTKRKVDTGQSQDGARGGDCSGTVQEWKNSEFIQIPTDEFRAFHPNTHGKRNVVYISIVDENGNWLCDNLSKKEDKSVIVDKEGRIRDAVYGTVHKYEW